MARREYKGASAKTRLSANIGAADTSFGINNAAGWPTGGANGNFIVTLDPDLSTEERILVGSRSANTLSGITRGVDDTTAVAHAAGADGTVIHSHSALDENEANRHINDVTIDEHTQYMKADGTRHDLTARHTYGAALGTRPTPIAVGTTLTAGTGAAASAGDHQHTVGVGAINAANMFTAGVVDAAAIGTDQVGTLEIAPLAVTPAELAADSVINTKIADAAIDDENMFGTALHPIISASVDPGAVGANRVWLNTNSAKRALLQRNAGNTNWEVIQSLTGIEYTPTLSGITIGNGINQARYRHHGSTIIADGFVKVGTTTTIDARIGLGLPITAKDLSALHADEFFFHGAGRASDVASGNAFGGVGIVGVGTLTFGNTKLDFIVTAGGVGWDVNVPFPWNLNDRFSWFVEYEPSTLVDANYV